VNRRRRIFAALTGAILLVAGSLPSAALAVDSAYFACANGSGYLSTATSAATISQGQSASYTLDITRIGCPDDISFLLWDVPPAGTTVTWTPNPTTGDSVVLTVATTTGTPVSTYGLGVNVQTGHSASQIYLILDLTVNPSIAPIEAVPVSQLRSGSIIGSTTTPVRTFWSATDPDGIARYTVQRRLDSGSWTTVVLPTTTTTGIYQSLSYGHRYQYRVRATDRLGHTSAWSYGKAFIPRIYQQTTSRFSSAWHWTTLYTSAASGGSLKYSPYGGTDFSYTFAASSVAWVAVAGPTRSNKFAVWIDWNLAATNLSLNRSTVQYRRIAYARSWATDVNHTYRVQDFGIQGHTRLDVDAFVLLDQVT
jgi:hypothetical protein